MLNELYPNRFKEWELKKTSTGFWTKEKGLHLADEFNIRFNVDY
ncbi:MULTISPECIES: hypothetical protein [Bacillus]|nr:MULTISPECIES: hypothetical protein [Bacillus cereus group]MED2924300.1 hypothetical protein [Bacillus thuringiensis]WIK98927.1 hypothetical protein QPL86_30380 [Bacillus bombysepticus]